MPMKNAVQLSELSENIGTTKKAIERDNAGARIIERWEQLVKTTASNVPGKTSIVTQQSSKKVG